MSEALEMEGHKTGLEASFAAVYTSQFPRVYAAALAFCGSADVAEEAVQEAFAKAFARWRRLSNEPWAVGWIVTTALNHTRRLSRSRPMPPPSSDEVGTDFSGFELLDALRELPRRQREVVILHYLHDLPVSVVADLLGVSEGSIKTHLSRARSALENSMRSDRDD